MALSATQIDKANSIYPDIQKGLDDSFAGIIKSRYLIIGMKYPGLADPQTLPNSYFRDLAKEAIDTRSISLEKADGTMLQLSLDDIDRTIAQIPGAQQSFTDYGMKGFSDLVPAREELNIIARRTAHAVAENYVDTNNPSGTRLTALKHFNKAFQNGWLGLIDKNRQYAAAADNIRTSVVEELEKLGAENPRIHLLLGDAANKDSNLNMLADKVRAQSLAEMKGEKETADALSKVEVLPVPDALREMARTEIRNQIFAKTQAAVTKGVDDEIDEVRSGKAFGGGFIGMLAGLLFPLLEFLGMEKMVAQWCGKPIPDEQQIATISNAAADAASQALTAPDFRYKDKTLSELRKDPKEFAAAIQSSVSAALNQNRGEFAAFDDKHIAKLARETGNAIAGQLDTIPDFGNSARQVAANLPAGTVDQLAKQSAPHVEVVANDAQVNAGGARIVAPGSQITGADNALKAAAQERAILQDASVNNADATMLTMRTQINPTLGRTT